MPNTFQYIHGDYGVIVAQGFVEPLDPEHNRIAAQLKYIFMKKGITFGAFDVLHAGHCLMLEEAKKHCDYLIVGLQTDPSTTSIEYRGKLKSKPIQTLEERLIQLKANRFVDEVIVYNTEEDLYKILVDLKPDIRIIGADWKDKKFTGSDLPIEVYYNTRSHSYSSTELRERIKNS